MAEGTMGIPRLTPAQVSDVPRRVGHGNAARGRENPAPEKDVPGPGKDVPGPGKDIPGVVLNFRGRHRMKV